ncbi:MAG: hypothetical protein LBG48_05380, partial [Rickettsiales bacterium]|nr:hypothetical protein [Rickettsiales bacterium]
ISTIKDLIIEGEVKKLEDINVEGAINIAEINKPNEEYMTVYYLLNDNADNPEFLDENVLTISKKETELIELKRKKEEFNFKLEELVDSDRVAVDLTGLVDENTNTA